MRASGHSARSHLLPAQAREEPRVRRLHLGVEPQRACRLGMGAGSPHQRRADPVDRPTRRGHDQPPTEPPADVPLRRGTKAHTAEQGALAVAREQHHQAPVDVALVVVVAREQALLLDEHRAAQRVVLRSVVRRFDGERGPARRRAGEDLPEHNPR
ncbi:MAG: hypothetical protein ACRDRK_17980 [Pseudonocardia sp.]